MKSFIGLILLALNGSAFALDGSSSTGGELPPESLRYRCVGEHDDMSYRVDVLDQDFTGGVTQAPYFEARVYRKLHGAKWETLARPLIVVETVSVHRAGIAIHYESRDEPLRMGLTIDTTTARKTGPYQYDYRGRLNFDCEPGTPMTNFPVTCEIDTITER